MIRQVLEAVDYMHEQGVVHRDLKVQIRHLLPCCKEFTFELFYFVISYLLLFFIFCHIIIASWPGVIHGGGELLSRIC